MKCPFRNKLVRDFEKAASGLVVKSETVEYPDCYGSECPFFDAVNSQTGCHSVDNEIAGGCE